MVMTAMRDEPATIGHAINQHMNQAASGHFDRLRGAGGWSPAINVYQLERRLEVCVELAGVEGSSIEVRVEPGRLTLRGVRSAPEPRRGREAMRIVAMEIDHGPFCRVVSLPGEVAAEGMTIRHEGGMLWVTLPWRGRV